MNNKEILELLMKYEVVQDKLDTTLTGEDFINDILYNFSQENPINKNTTIDELNKLSNNVKKQVILCHLNDLHKITHPEWGVISMFDFKSIDEMLEYAKFYYENSEESSVYKESSNYKLSKSMLSEELKKL